MMICVNKIEYKCRASQLSLLSNMPLALIADCYVQG